MSSTLKVDILQDSGGNNLVTSNGSGVITAASFGKIGQVKHAIKTDTQSFSAALTFADITDLSIAITPNSTSSKFFVGFNVVVGGPANAQTSYIRAVRDSTPLTVADTAGNRTSAANVISTAAIYDTFVASNTYLDSPATTSEITYKIQFTSSNTTAAYVNRTNRDANFNTYDGRSVSTMYVMEVLP